MVRSLSRRGSPQTLRWRRSLPALLLPVFLVLLAPWLSPPSLTAQAPTTDARFSDASEEPNLWAGIGLGAGTLRFTCDLCATGRDGGPSAFLLVGARASPRLRVAVEAGGWTRKDGNVRETLYRGGLTGFYHPRPESGLHLLAGLGWVGYRADDIGYDSAALSVGLGWDWPFLEDWSVGNAVRIDAASFGRFRTDDERVVGDVGLSLVRFEVTLKRSSFP